MTTKICNKCGIEKSIESFRLKEKRVRGECRGCEAERQRRHHKNNPEKTLAAVKKWQKKNPNVVKEHQRKTRYGITGDQYQQMLKEQNGVCAICKEIGIKGLAVDHCHSTGKIRGLLCMSCNTALGHLKDSFSLVLKVASYIRKFST